MNPPKIGRYKSPNHPAIVTVFDVTEPDDDGFFLVSAEAEGDPIAMEFTPEEWQDFFIAARLTPA